MIAGDENIDTNNEPMPEDVPIPEVPILTEPTQLSVFNHNSPYFIDPYQFELPDNGGSMFHRTTDADGRQIEDPFVSARVVSMYDIVYTNRGEILPYIKRIISLLMETYLGTPQDRLTDLNIYTSLPNYLASGIRYISAFDEIKEVHIRELVGTIKQKALEDAGVTKDRFKALKIEKNHFRHMIFEAALICILARHPSNKDILIEDPAIFTNRYSENFPFLRKNDEDFKMFWRYYYTMQVAAPLFYLTKNQGHSLKLLPRLVEARNIEYQFGGKSSSYIRLRIKIYVVELDRWKLTTLTDTDNRLDFLSAGQAVARGAGQVADLTFFPNSTDVAAAATIIGMRDHLRINIAEEADVHDLLPVDNGISAQTTNKKKRTDASSYEEDSEVEFKSFKAALMPLIERLKPLNWKPGELFSVLEAHAEDVVNNVERAEKEEREKACLRIKKSLFNQINRSVTPRTQRSTELPFESGNNASGL